MRADVVPVGEEPIDPPSLPEQIPEIIADEPETEIRAGLIIAGLFFILFLGWTAIARLDAAAYAAGWVSVSGQRQTVQHRDGGVIGELLVKEGQRVAGGQILLRLAAADVQAQERALALQAIELLAQRARLRAEQLGLANIAQPPEFTGLDGADRIAAMQAMQLQSDQLRARASLQATQQGVLGQDTARVREQRGGFERQLVAVREQERLINEELDAYRPLAEKGFISKTRMRALERSKAELAGQRGQLEAAISESSASAGQSRLRVVESKQSLHERVTTELREVEFALSDISPKLRAAKDQLARTEVRAPASGIVVGLSIFTEGGVISPGQKLMDIVPDNSSLVVEARFSPKDIDDLKVGQRATVRFSGLASRSLPPLHGTVRRISADAFIDEKTGTSYFTGEIGVLPDQFRLIERELGTGFALKPGMPVEILIPLRKRTALQYILEPLTGPLSRSFRDN